MFSSLAVFASVELPSFPNAEGFGAMSKGGRGGRVIKVSNLNASGPGSLQAAASAEGARTIVFEVSGVIRGDIEIKHSNITIAGQSAPSPGITIVGRLLARPQNGERLHDIVVRFLRFRPSPTTGHNGDTIQLPNTERVILDHLSLSWANDEVVDIIHSSEITVQWCTIEESDPVGHGKGKPHNFAILSTYPGSGNISIHHNLFAHHARRLPSLSPYEYGKPGDFRNNVIYNFYEGFGHDGHTPASGINLIANYYKPGPSARVIFPFHFVDKGRYYLSGNYIEGVGIVNDLDDVGFFDRLWVKVNGKGNFLAQPFPVAPVVTNTAKEAYSKVLSSAGAFPRDKVTDRTIDEVRSGRGKWGRHGPVKPSDSWLVGDLDSEPSANDSDGDGMPDFWERRNGLNFQDNSDMNQTMASGYTAIEEYLHYAAERAVAQHSAK